MPESYQDDPQDISQEIKQEGSLNPSYTDMVDEFAKENSDIEFSNSSINHARYITCKMIERGEDEMLILSGTINELYFNKTVKKLLEKHIGQYRAIKIITVQETNLEKMKSLFDFTKDLNKKSKKDILSYLPLENKGDAKNFQHFYVVDKKSWRKEAPHDIYDNPQDVHADVCFNDPVEGKFLHEDFMELWDKFYESNNT